MEAVHVEDGAAAAATPDTGAATASIKGQVGRVARRLQSISFQNSVTLIKKLKKTNGRVHAIHRCRPCNELGGMRCSGCGRSIETCTHI